MPERVFSVNKKILDVHGYSTSELTIQSLRIVKDCIHQYGAATKVPIPVALLDKCKDAKANYNAALQKAKEEAEAKEKRCKADEQRIADQQNNALKLKGVEKKINDVNYKIKFAENLIQEAGVELQNVASTDKTKINTNSLVPITEEMNMGMG